MRLFAACAAVALCVVACGQPSDPAPAATSAGPVIDPDRVQRVRAELPAGYEVAALSAPTAPATLWGFGPDWVAEPVECGALAEPVPNATINQGWSASGAGGIIYTVVAGSPPRPVPFDTKLVDQCSQWSMSSGHTSGQLTLVPAPAIADAPTVGMSATATTVVEGGTETRSHAETVTAYLGDHVATVTVVTDPGSHSPQLGPEFVADLLTKTVAALRS